MSHSFVDQMLDKTRAGELRSPVSNTLGMQLVAFGRGEATYEMAAAAELGNPLGVIQGGVVTALADAAMAAATTSVLDDEEIKTNAITTVDIFARFIRPVNAKKIDTLRAEARVVRAGGRLVWAEAEVLADGDMVGKFASTYIMEFVYGEVYAGDVLDPKTRALCTVAMLGCLGEQLQLGVYVRVARRQGASEEEIREVLRQVAVYAGFPTAWNALGTMGRALEDVQPRADAEESDR
jgi:4-carboxymuconolactone decarboxylase